MDPNLQSVELVSHGEKSGETRQIHGNELELEATFDIFKGNLRLVEKVRNPEIGRETRHKEVLFLNQSNSSFLNLEGLNDNSLLLSFKPDPPMKVDLFKKIRHCQQSHDFVRHIVDNPLRNAILDHGSENRIFFLRVPKHCHHGWKTIALVLLTYRKISPKTWHRIVINRSLLDVAGFDWGHICQNLKKGN
jgi:hypothetical protein